MSQELQGRVYSNRKSVNKVRAPRSWTAHCWCKAMFLSWTEY